MASKQTQSKDVQEPAIHDSKTNDQGDMKSSDLDNAEASSSTGEKRKKHLTDAAPHKAQKTEKNEQASTPDARSDVSSEKILKFLLSDEAIDICRSSDELEDVSKRGSELKTYSSLLSPFEELLCAIILSRPISHRLGLRTIRTVLNPPYSFNSTESIKDAGSEKIRQALDDAHTQHKGKTSEEIELLAESFEKNDWDNDLEKIRKHGKGGVEEEREVLRKSIKGLGKTGLDIFYRRIQWMWDEAFPFVDEKSKAALEKLGLSGEAEELLKMIDSGGYDFNNDSGEKFSKEELRRRRFVLVLERALSADLEKKVDKVLKAAGNT